MKVHMGDLKMRVRFGCDAHEHGGDPMTLLSQLDLGQRLDKEQYYKRLEDEQRRLLQLRLHLGGHMGAGHRGPGLLVLFEGPDAAGKGGAIKAIVGHLDPRHYNVLNYAAPTRVEKEHHFLWRFWKEVPGLGEMAVFDRSWYGRVLVERIEGYATRAEWSRAFRAMVDFERTLVSEGVIVVKFWLHISDEEQHARFVARAEDPLKRWKLTDEDWRNRGRNRLYDRAAEEMFRRTNHVLAPWEIIAAEQKRFARISVLETLNRRIEEGMVRFGMEVPALSELDDTDD
jgi:AMP-polyphosphate phosphotransferase